MAAEGAKPAFGGASSSQGKGASGQVFKQIEGLMNEDLVKSMGGIFQFNLKGICFLLILSVPINFFLMNRGVKTFNLHIIGTFIIMHGIWNFLLWFFYMKRWQTCFVAPLHQFVILSVHLFVILSVHLSIILSVHLSVILSVHLPVNLFVILSVHLSLILSVHVFQSIFDFISPCGYVCPSFSDSISPSVCDSVC